MAISTNPMPTIYRNLYENRGPVERQCVFHAQGQHTQYVHVHFIMFIRVVIARTFLVIARTFLCIDYQVTSACLLI